MTIMILNVSNEQMTATEWLETAAHAERDGFTDPHAFIAADGVRMHIANNIRSACKCGNQKIHDGFNRVIEGAKQTNFAFAVSRQYLIEALAGIDSETVLFYVSSPTAPIVVQDMLDERTAIIMPQSVGILGTPNIAKLTEETE